MKNSDSIEEELGLAGEVSSVSDMQVKLDKFRITTDTDVPEEEFLMRFFGKPCFPRRDLSTITGLEKCGKTFFTSMLMACCAEKQVLSLERVSDQPLKVLWLDTEQSKSSTKELLTERVFKLAQGDESEVSKNFFVFNVRSCSYQERMDYLVTAIEAYKPDLVIIDNVSDLLPSVNDAEASIRLIDQLMQIASEYNCHISVVIHLNRSGDKRNLRGWLGTEILHKVFEAYYCEHIDKSDVFSVEQTLSRKHHTKDKLYYTINDEGLPQSATEPITQPRNSNGQYTTSKAAAYQVQGSTADNFNQQYIIRHPDDPQNPWEWNLTSLFRDALGNRATMPLDNLKHEVMALSGIKYDGYYEKVFDLAVDLRAVKTTMDRNGRMVVVNMPS